MSYDRRITIRLPERMAKDVEEYCESNEIQISEYFRDLIRKDRSQVRAGA